jgi:hypothetical protein
VLPETEMTGLLQIEFVTIWKETAANYFKASILTFA